MLQIPLNFLKYWPAHPDSSLVKEHQAGHYHLYLECGVKLTPAQARALAEFPEVLGPKTHELKLMDLVRFDSDGAHLTPRGVQALGDLENERGYAGYYRTAKSYGTVVYLEAYVGREQGTLLRTPLGPVDRTLAHLGWVRFHPIEGADLVEVEVTEKGFQALEQSRRIRGMAPAKRHLQLGLDDPALPDALARSSQYYVCVRGHGRVTRAQFEAMVDDPSKCPDHVTDYTAFVSAVLNRQPNASIWFLNLFA